MGCGYHEQPFSACLGCGTNSGSSSAIEAQMGFRISGWPVGIRTAERGFRPRFRRDRHRLHLLLGRSDGLRLLVFSDQGGRSQCDDHRARESARGGEIRRVLRRPEGKCLRPGRTNRRVAVGHGRGQSPYGANHRGAHLLRWTPLCPSLILGGVLRSNPRLSLLHVSRQCARPRCQHG